MVFPPVKKFQFTITVAKCKKCFKPPGRSETLKPLRRVIVAARARSTSLQLPILDCGSILQESAQKINYPKQLFCLFSPPQYNGDEVQILAADWLHCLAVACGVLVVLGQPIGPDLLVARHLPGGEDFCPPGSRRRCASNRPRRVYSPAAPASRTGAAPGAGGRGSRAYVGETVSAGNCRPVWSMV